MLSREEIISLVTSGFDWLVPAGYDELVKEIKKELGLWKRYLKS